MFMQVTDEDWTTRVPGPTRIPFWLLGSTDVPDGLPEQLEVPAEQLQPLRLRLDQARLSSQF